MHSIRKRCGRLAIFMAARRTLALVFSLLLFYACAASVAAGIEPAPPSKWQVSTQPSAGEDSIVLTLKAEKPVAGWMRTFVPVLTLQCNKGKAALYIETGMALEVTMVDQQIVHVQIDDNTPITQRWREVNNATVSASARDTALLVKQLTQSRKFRFEFIPFNTTSAQAEFTVAGLDTYLPRLNRACWGK